MADPAETLDAMRARAPLVQNITNFVAMNYAANVLLAAGASPAMVHARAEAAEFAGLADALSVNIGTADPEWGLSMEAAAGAARGPWVLDPVAVGATAFRRDLGARLLKARPTILRGNASEILAIGGAEARGQGADTGDAVAAAEKTAGQIARGQGAVVAVTGPEDFVTDGTQWARVGGGHPLMAKVTTMGCALTALVAAFAVDQDPFDATVGALAYYGVAGEMAGETVSGPGSFVPAFLDALHSLTPQDVAGRAKVTLS